MEREKVQHCMRQGAEPNACQTYQKYVEKHDFSCCRYRADGALACERDKCTGAKPSTHTDVPVLPKTCAINTPKPWGGASV